jgi:hypothetical protein
MTRPHEITDNNRRIAEQMSGLGLPHEQIGAIIGIDDKTLRKYYTPELRIGKAKASSNVAKTLYEKAVAGDTTACIWWTKAQMSWCEKTKTEHSGTVGFSDMTTEEIDRRIAALLDSENARTAD